jgi:hypothetical protein
MEIQSFIQPTRGLATALIALTTLALAEAKPFVFGMNKP